MPSVTTLAELRVKAIHDADMTSSGFAVADRVDEDINLELGELYDLVVMAYEDDFVTTANVSVVTGTESYSLPSDFYKSRKVFWKTSDRRYRLRRFMLSDLESRIGDYTALGSSGRNLYYRVLGDKIYFSPKPIESGTVELFYLPEMTKLVADSDPISFSIPVSSWEDAVIAGAAARLLIREDSDPTPLLSRKASVIQRIMRAASDRDAGEPQRVTDVHNRFGYMPIYGV